MELDSQDQTPSPTLKPVKSRKYTARKITRRQEGQILEMAAQNQSLLTIAKRFDLSEKAVSKFLHQYDGLFKLLPDVDNYRHAKARLFDAAEFRILQSLVQESKIKKASLNNCAYALKVLHEAGRLEKGLSTSNVHTKTYTQIVNEYQEPAVKKD